MTHRNRSVFAPDDGEAGGGIQRAHTGTMKVSTVLRVLAISLLVQHTLGQQSCYCSSDDCSCTTNSTSDGSNASSSDALAPGNPPVGSRDFLTPTGDYQSPDTPSKPVRAANEQQYIWVGAAMISSDDNAIVLGGQEGIADPDLSSDGTPEPSVTLLYKWNSTCGATIQMDVNGSMTIFLAPISVGNSTKRCAADEDTSCAVDIDTLDPTVDYGVFGMLDAYQMRPVYYNFTAIFQGCSSPVSLAAAQPATAPVAYPWGRYNSDFLLGSRPYVAAAMIGATYVTYNISVYAAVASPSNVTLMPMQAMVMTGSNFTDFQTDSAGGARNAVPYSIPGSVCASQPDNRCLAQLTLDPTDDIYFVVAFLNERAFAQQYPGRRIRPHMLGVALVSYCSSGDGGVCTTEALQDVPLNSPLRPSSNDTSSDSSAAGAPAPAAALPPSSTGTGRPSTFTKPAISTGGPPAWNNATGTASPPLPAVNGTMASKAPRSTPSRNSTISSDASQEQAAQQLLTGILGMLGLNVTDLANTTSDASSTNSTSTSDNSLFG